MTVQHPRPMVLLTWLVTFVALATAPAASAGSVSLAIEPATDITPTSITVWGVATGDVATLSGAWSTRVLPADAAASSTMLTLAPGATRVRVPQTITGLMPGTRYVVTMSAFSEGREIVSDPVSVWTAREGGLAPHNTTAPKLGWAWSPGVVDAAASDLACDPGRWSGDGSISAAVVRWLRDGSVISVLGVLPDPGVGGGTSGDGPVNRYWPTAAERGHQISCEVTATSEYGTSTLASNSVFVPLSSSPPKPSVPEVQASPTLIVAGTPMVARLMGGSTAYGTVQCLATPPVPEESTWQWLRGGQPIAGATGSSYTVTDEDVGQTLACRLTVPSVGVSVSPPVRVLSQVTVFTWDRPRAPQSSPSSGSSARRKTFAESLHDGLLGRRTLRFELPPGTLVVTWRDRAHLLGQGICVQTRRGPAHLTVRLNRTGRRTLTAHHAVAVTARAAFRSTATGHQTFAARRVVLRSP